MRKLFLCLFCCFALFAESETARYIESPWNCKNKESEELLFILHAKDGNLERIGRNTYQLTLYHVDRNATYFTDRPGRKAGKIPVEQFLLMWRNGKNPPNAGIVSVSKTREKFHDIPAVLENPCYDQMNHRLTFEIRPLERGQRIPEGDVGETTLFIDNIPPEWNSRGV